MFFSVPRANHHLTSGFYRLTSDLYKTMQQFRDRSFEWVDVHTHRASTQEGVLSLRNVMQGEVLPRGQFCSVGLHPWYLDPGSWEQDFEELAAKAAFAEVLAIGEAGLDRAISLDFGLQQQVFSRHIELAEQLQKPLIIHCVKAYPDAVALHKKHRPQMPWVFHGFGGNRQIADQLLRNGCYLSFGEILFRDKAKAASAFAHIPADRLFLETDDGERPFLEIVAKAAQLRGCQKSDLKTILADNFLQVFSGE